MNRRRILQGICVCFFGFIVFAAVIVSNAVFADGGAAEGGAWGGGGQPGCAGRPLSTCYGAQWRYYTADSDEIPIPGGKSGYNRGGTITNCKTYGGGYYRYAMVADGTQGYGPLYYSYGYARFYGWRYSDQIGNYQGGEQVGLIGIGGHNDQANGDGPIYNSRWFSGGGMNYIGTWDDWEKVHQKYLRAQRMWPDQLVYGWDENSPLAWFCYSDPKPYGKSSVVVDQRTSANTGIVNELGPTVYARAPADLMSSSLASVSLMFEHSVYLDFIFEKTENVEWSIEREFSMSGSGYLIDTESTKEGKSFGTSVFRDYRDEDRCLDYGDCAYYTPDNNELSYGDWGYTVHHVTRDTYNDVYFNRNGVYTFCESLYVESPHFEKKQVTRVCAEVTVDFAGWKDKAEEEDDDDIVKDPTCENWKPSRDWADTQTRVLTMVKNTTLKQDYSPGPVYAKPNDIIDWAHCYYPGVQTQTERETTITHHAHEYTEVDGQREQPNVNGPVKDVLGSNWGNYFSIETQNLIGKKQKYGPGAPDNFTYPIGDATVRRLEDERTKYQVQNHQAGETKELKQKIISSYPSSVDIFGKYCSWICGYIEEPQDDGRVKSTPYSCFHGDFTYENRFGKAVEASASVFVPYNFTTEPKISIGTNPIYSGETFDIGRVEVVVKKRQNETTKGNYATEVPGAKVRTYVYLSDSNSGSVETVDNENSVCGILPTVGGRCELLGSKNGLELNNTGNPEGSTDLIEGLSNRSYNAYDYDAGSYICVVAAAFPANSGSSTNIKTSGFSGWTVSKPSCAKIAKRPSFQVWGGSLYSRGAVMTSVAKKTNLYHKNDYAVNGGSRTVFGSWVEQGVVGISTITGLASGAAGGNGLEVANDNKYYCKYLVPLSFANYSDRIADGICPNAQASGKIASSGSIPNRASLISYWKRPAATTNERININDIAVSEAGIGNRKVKYAYKEGALAVTESLVSKFTTYIVNATGNITIEGNLKYNDASSFTSSSEIPKVIIYSKKNINISCDVTRLDAILIAGGSVNTCSDGGGVNSESRSKRLLINGVVITNKLILNRTYGAGKGERSGEAAEIINYDSTSLLWGVNMADAADSNKLTETYLHELAPRY